MILIKFTQQDIQNTFDYIDGFLYWKDPKSNRVINRRLAGYKTKHNYRKVHFFGKQIYEHRLIFMMHYGFMPKYIDHIDGNKSNNKIENLREVEHYQNMMNVKIKKNNSSGIKGVCFDKNRSKWMVRITANNKTINLGRYDDLELAELVAQEARHKYHKNYANFC